MTTLAEIRARREAATGFDLRADDAFRARAREDVTWLIAAVEELRATQAEHERSFELRHAADMRAIKRWRALCPAERELVWPDHADLVVWLLTERDALERVAEAVNSHEGPSVMLPPQLEGWDRRVRAALADLASLRKISPVTDEETP